VVQAGLFSVVTSAFIIQFDSRLQPDPNDETAALLRVLIYKIDNTTFGNSVPTLPLWANPPQTIVQVQAILYASLAISLFSAFLAMLGKQWLNRYQSKDMRGSAIERSHNRQQKLDGIVAWYFDYVMESLPLMLQTALLLLGCALSRYLWGIDSVIASVVLGVTSFGVIFYLFIVIAGTASESCPYQTPAARIFRHILRHLHNHLLPILYSAPPAIFAAISSNCSRLYRASWCCHGLFSLWSAMGRPWYSMWNIIITLSLPIWVLAALVHDAYYLGQMIFQSLVAFGRTVHHQLMGSHRTTYRWFTDISSLRVLDPGQQAIAMDLRCISWILQTSLDKVIHLSAFKHLTSMPELAYFHPTLVFACFDVFTRSVSVSNGRVVIMRGFEQFAMVSAAALFRTLHHLATMDPTSSALVDLQQRYDEVFPSELDVTNLPFYSTMTDIHALAGRFGNPRDIRWHNHRMPVQEHTLFARLLVQAAREGYQQTEHRKVPRWILRSALYFLSLGPVSLPSTVADCLTIVAIDLGCDVPDAFISNER
jgi:hypothetical protein